MNNSFFEKLKELAERTPKPVEEIYYTVTPFPKCAKCNTFNVPFEGNWCEQCTREKEQGYQILSMLGRLANGFEMGKGALFHAVPHDSYKAVCGAEPGRRRSVGWTFDPEGHGKEVTCPRCIRKLNNAKTRE